LHYAHVAEPGLSVVRNFALRWARHRFTHLAMLDDDENPEPQWLSELLRVCDRTGAEVVVGPVPALLPSDAPRWLRDFRELELPTARDCAMLSDGWSGNCLLALEAVGRLGVTFDPALNFAGGEDQLFFRQILYRGGKVAYAARATAWEFTPPERRSVGFVIKRSFRRGNSLSMCDMRIGGTARAVGLRALKGAGRVALGTLAIVPLTILRGPSGTVSSLCDVALGVGMLAGILGYTYQPYRRPEPIRLGARARGESGSV
jgi:succinoglycan biosynthesis protein ExoM